MIKQQSDLRKVFSLLFSDQRTSENNPSFWGVVQRRKQNLVLWGCVQLENRVAISPPTPSFGQDVSQHLTTRGISVCVAVEFANVRNLTLCAEGYSC